MRDWDFLNIQSLPKGPSKRKRKTTPGYRCLSLTFVVDNDWYGSQKEFVINSYKSPPTPEEVIQQFMSRMRTFFKRSGRGFSLLLIVPILLWLATGIVLVDPDEEGVMLRFGKYVRSVGPGPHWNWPVPIGRTITPRVTTVRKIEVGFRTVDVGPPARYQSVPVEALMLTGDENIVSLEFIVQYKISDAYKFLFRVRDGEGVLRDVAESAMREVIGQTPIDLALTEGKGKIQNQAQDLIQTMMDDYESGIQIVTVKLQDVDPPDQVADAFKDVQNAQQDRQKRINDAKGVQNKLIPEARGKSAQMINDAQAYRESRIREAEGEAQRFKSLLVEYRKAREVTRKRLYIETMEEVLGKMNKYVMEGSISQNTLPYLPLNELPKAGKSGGSK